ncbi:efflux RND transporter periplasmic adaptor subunit [Arcticibacterium luteifluviistationis]|uniref:Efflux transporter periplasmic adaptor subunit n=1 Tax=Arcticibacterium luteifluviistationis TaxID=1784714 RepID=A0A2Z4GI23_9BACT|nr:efflux RND transporter periplasmic adaptor subunit [Arcticibacterium luteifluviistationis]AWW00967.1 efflux transporter periplasmic adaptor subunit [Arcticibacterium luteifluviistationis]
MDRKIEKKYWTVKRLGLIAVGILVIALIAYNFLYADHRSKLNVETDKISISEVSEGIFDEFIIVQGVVQPLKTIQLDAIVGGYVTNKLVEGGNMVNQGQIILRLENQQLKLNFLQSETEASRLVNELQNTRQRLRVERFNLQKTLSDLDFQIAQAKDSFDRNQQLKNDNVVSDMEYMRTKRDYDKLVKQREIEIQSQKYQQENAEIQIKQLEGTLERTERNVELWRQTLQNLVVKAPVAGLLSSIDVEIGSNINQGQNIGQIDDMNGFKMRVEIDEHYISRIFAGLQANFDFNGSTHKMEITKVYPEVLNGRFGVDMVFADGTPEGIRRGQSSPIRLELGKSEKATLLPVGGFFSDTGGNWVYVVEKDGSKATKRNITLGRKNPRHYEVLDGLNPGEKVVTSSYGNFGDKEVLELK